MAKTNRRSELVVNSFLRLRKLCVGEREMLKVNDPGDAERLLSNPQYLYEMVYELLNRGIVPTEDGWVAGSENIKPPCARRLSKSRRWNRTGCARRSDAGTFHLGVDGARVFPSQGPVSPKLSSRHEKGKLLPCPGKLDAFPALIILVFPLVFFS